MQCLCRRKRKNYVNCVSEMLDNQSWIVCRPQVLVSFKTRNPGILDAKPRFHFVVSLFWDDFRFEVCNLFTDRSIDCVYVFG